MAIFFIVGILFSILWSVRSVRSVRNVRGHSFNIVLFFVVFCISGFNVSYGMSQIRELLSANDLDEGMKICRQYESLSVMDPDNELACAQVYIRLNKLESAIGLLNKVKEKRIVPEYYLIQALYDIKKHNYLVAKKNLSDLSKQYSQGHFAISIEEATAELYEAMGQLDAAAFLYRQVIEDDSQRTRSHWGLARYYLGKGDFVKAKSELQQTAARWPKHLGSRYNLAVLAIQSGDLEEAGSWLGECYKIDKSDIGVLEQLGVLYERKNQIPQAIKYWQMARDLGGSNQSKLAVSKLALYMNQNLDILIHDKKYEVALKQITPYFNTIQNYPGLLYRRGKIYNGLTLYNKALLDLLVYVKSVPNDGGGWKELGISYINSKDLIKAEKCFLRASKLLPKDPMVYIWLGFIFEARKNYQESYIAWNRAISYLLDPNMVQKATRRMVLLEQKLSPDDRKKIIARLKQNPFSQGTRLPASEGMKH